MKKHRSNLVAGLASALVLLGAASGALASTLTPIPSFVGSGTTSVLDINDSGAMTGSIGQTDGSAVGFSRASGGVYSTFSNGDAFFTQGRAISNAGAITGYSTDATANLRTDSEFLRSSGGSINNLQNPTTLTPLHEIAQGMNASGVIVGGYYTTVGASTVRHGYILDGSTFMDLSVTGSPSSTLVARGINDGGTVVGWGTNGAATEGFVDIGGAFSWFADPGAAGGGTTHFEDINNAGLIAGEWVDGATGFSHAFEFNSLSDVFTEIVVPGATNAQAFGLNNAGQVVITTDIAKGPNNFIFNALAVPEPATWAMMLTGLFGAGAVLRRKRQRAIAI